MTEALAKPAPYIHRGIRFGQPASKVCDIKREIHSRKPGKIPGQQPSALNLRMRNVKAARGDAGEPKRACACNQPAQPCAGTATRIQNADRACPGSAQVSQLCLQKSPDAPIRICMHSVKGKQLRRIAVSISDRSEEHTSELQSL